MIGPGPTILSALLRRGLFGQHAPLLLAPAARLLALAGRQQAGVLDALDSPRRVLPALNPIDRVHGLRGPEARRVRLLGLLGGAGLELLALLADPLGAPLFLLAQLRDHDVAPDD